MLRTMQTVASAAALGTFGSLEAQTPADPIAKHRATYETIEASLKRYQPAAATMDTLGLEQRSADGGRVEASCDGRTLRLLVADCYGEVGDVPYRFYVDEGSLLRIQAISPRPPRRKIPVQ